jgi:hypothetical protein
MSYKLYRLQRKIRKLEKKLDFYNEKLIEESRKKKVLVVKED